jgi:16S rRNA (cytidine1402-2'-O)-methyltransferase
MTDQPAKPALLLLPNLLGDTPHHQLFLPSSVDKAVGTLDGLIAESYQAGRRYLSRFPTKMPASQVPVAVYNKDTPDKDLDFYLEPIKKGERWGLISDAGLPCVADPGAKLVFRARQQGVTIQAFVGPSSMMMALMLSGLSGQYFGFHGYLERDKNKQISQIKKLEKRSYDENSTQIIMEAPYRSAELLKTLIEALDEKTLLCTAWDLTLPTQGIITQTAATWKKMALPDLDKHNCLFLFNGSRI